MRSRPRSDLIVGVAALALGLMSLACGQDHARATTRTLAFGGEEVDQGYIDGLWAHDDGLDCEVDAARTRIEWGEPLGPYDTSESAARSGIERAREYDPELPGDSFDVALAADGQTGYARLSDGDELAVVLPIRETDGQFFSLGYITCPPEQ